MPILGKLSDMLELEFVLQAMRAATQEVFTMMLGAAIELDENARCDTESGLMSLVGLTGAWSGAGTLSCSPALANKAAAVMFMSEPSTDPSAINDEVLDAVAEL